MKSLLQTQEWATLKEKQGWKIHDPDEIFVLEKKLPLGKTFLYAPEVSFAQITDFNRFITKVDKIARNINSIFFRLELLDEKVEKNIEIIENLQKYKFHKAFEEIQPEYRQIIPIAGSNEAILTQMKTKGRYNIKVAERHGVEVKVIGSENLKQGLDEFYKIFTETAKRDGFSIRPREYFQTLLDTLGTKGYTELLVAYLNNVAIAAEIVTYYDETASYLYGSSANNFRNVMAPYLMHWAAIKRARAKGCKYYDLLAIAPFDSDQGLVDSGQSENQKQKIINHKYSGITRFKEQFGGRSVNIIGSYDLVYQPIWYEIFKTIEKIRRGK